MKKFIRTLYQSFFSHRFYNEVAHQWQGTGIGLLAWLSLLGTLIFAVAILVFSSVVGTDYSKFKEDLIVQTPQVTVANGELSIDKPVPYYINFEGKEEGRFALVDTTPAAAAMNLDQILAKMRAEKLAMFASKSEVVVIKNQNEFQVYDLKEVKEPIKFGKDEMRKFISMMEILFVPFMSLFIFLFVWVYKIIQMLLYSLITLLVDKFVKSGLEYEAMQRITTCALFPATIIGVVFALLGLGMPFLLSFAITVILTIFGLKSAKTVA